MQLMAQASNSQHKLSLCWVSTWLSCGGVFSSTWVDIVNILQSSRFFVGLWAIFILGGGRLTRGFRSQLKCGPLQVWVIWWISQFVMVVWKSFGLEPHQQLASLLWIIAACGARTTP